MNKFNYKKAPINDLIIIQPTVYHDQRGHFFESFNENDFQMLSIPLHFVQENYSKSKKNVLRGMHYQNTHPQGKLIQTIVGSIYDVAIDIRRNSETYGQWFGIILSAENHKQLYIPQGFAHGFYVIDDAIVQYKCTDFYDPNDQQGIRWDDPKVQIQWPTTDNTVILSDKDQNWKYL